MKYKFIQDIDIVCKYLHISREKLAEKIEIPFETISRFSNKDIVPSDDILEKFYSFVYEQGIELNQTKIESYKKRHDVLLFHGSKEGMVDSISLDHSRKRVDLGVGFYTEDNYHQSLEFISNTNHGSIYVLDVKYAKLKILNIDVSLKWLLMIALCRGKLEKYNHTRIYQDILKELSSYDIIIAPIADNRMFTTIDDFISSAISSEQAIHAMKVLSLGKQIVFKTKASLTHLKVLERLYVCKNEKADTEFKKKQKLLDNSALITEAYEKYIRQGLYISEFFKNEKDGL